jgi:hypothetical protein
MLAAALAWAAAGRPVFPVGRDKRPLTAHGLLDATTDPAVIRRWWIRWPNASIALRTGEPSGLVVLDADPRHGGDDSLHDLERRHGALPATRTVVTPSGGEHYYFRWPGVWIKSTAPMVPELPGLDMRGDGGYVVVPPSRGYEHDSVAPLAPMPPCLIELARDDRTGDRRRVPAGVWTRMFVDGIPDGERNVDLTRLTGHLIRHYVAVDLAAALVHLANRAWCTTPLPGSEVDRIIDSVAGMELRRRERRNG